MTQFVPTVLLLILTAVWGWTFTVVQDGVNEYGALPFLSVRFFLAYAALLPFCYRHLDWTIARIGGGIGIVLAISYFFQTYSLKLTTATECGIINGLFCVFAPISNRLIFKVSIPRAYWFAIMASMVGLGLLVFFEPRAEETGAGSSILGNLLALGGGIGFGVHIALLDRYARGRNAAALALAQVVATMVLCTVVCLPLAPITWPSPRVWRALAITGILATALGFFIQTYSQQRMEAVRAAVILALEPLFAALFGVWLAGDRLTPLQWLGAALMILSLFFIELYPFLRLKFMPQPPAAS